MLSPCFSEPHSQCASLPDFPSPINFSDADSDIYIVSDVGQGLSVLFDSPATPTYFLQRTMYSMSLSKLTEWVLQGYVLTLVVILQAVGLNRGLCKEDERDCKDLPILLIPSGPEEGWIVV